jgi:hypothetical protein
MYNAGALIGEADQGAQQAQRDDRQIVRPYLQQHIIASGKQKRGMSLAARTAEAERSSWRRRSSGCACADSTLLAKLLRSLPPPELQQAHNADKLCFTASSSESEQP